MLSAGPGPYRAPVPGPHPPGSARAGRAAAAGPAHCALQRPGPVRRAGRSGGPHRPGEGGAGALSAVAAAPPAACSLFQYRNEPEGGRFEGVSGGLVQTAVSCPGRSVLGEGRRWLLFLWSLWARGARVWARRRATRKRCPGSCPHGPKGSRRSVGLVHKSTGLPRRRRSASPACGGRTGRLWRGAAPRAGEAAGNAGPGSSQAPRTVLMLRSATRRGWLATAGRVRGGRGGRIPGRSRHEPGRRALRTTRRA